MVQMKLLLMLLVPSFGLPADPGENNSLERDKRELDCSCNGVSNAYGEGECKTDWPEGSNKFWCFVDSGSCSDAVEEHGEFWSYQACDKGNGIIGLGSGFIGQINFHLFDSILAWHKIDIFRYKFEAGMINFRILGEIFLLIK